MEAPKFAMIGGKYKYYIYCNHYLFTSFYKIEKEKKVKDNK